MKEGQWSSREKNHKPLLQKASLGLSLISQKSLWSQKIYRSLQLQNSQKIFYHKFINDYDAIIY